MAVFVARSLCQASRLPVSLTVPAILDQQDVAVASITASCSPSHPNFSVNVCLPRYTDRLTNLSKHESFISFTQTSCKQSRAFGSMAYVCYSAINVSYTKYSRTSQ